MKEAKNTLLMLAGTAVFIIIAGMFFGNGLDGLSLKGNGGGGFVSSPSVGVDRVVEINGVEVVVTIADTQAKRAKGLSGVVSLGVNEGKLFVFDEPSSNPFWMKDMKIAIDIIWIADGSVVDLTESVQPPLDGVKDSQLKLYAPSDPVGHVLEVNAGFVEENGIEVGDVVGLPY